MPPAFSAKVSAPKRVARCCAAKAHKVDRRAALGFVATALQSPLQAGTATIQTPQRFSACIAQHQQCLGVLAAVAPKADAIVIPSQESTGSTRKEGSLPPSTSEASMSSYTMEGIKKRGITPKRKDEIMKELREKSAKE